MRADFQKMDIIPSFDKERAPIAVNINAACALELADKGVIIQERMESVFLE